MAELQFPDIVGRFQQGQQLGMQQRQQREQQQRQSRLSELASLAYGAEGAERQGLLQQAYGVDPEFASGLSRQLGSEDESRQKALLQSARLLQSAPEASRPALYQRIRPAMLQHLPDLPEQYGPEVEQGTRAFITAFGGGGAPDVKVVGNALVDPTGRVIYQAPQRYLTEQGLIEVGPEGAREVMLGGAAPAQVGAIGDVQPGTGFSIGADIPPEVAAQIAAQERAAGGVQVGSMPGQRILPRGAGAEQERLQLARQAAARSEEAAQLAREAAAQRQQFGTIPAGFRVNAAGTALEPVPGGPKPAGAAATEDERKAAGWFNQASRARQNISEVLLQNPGADQPGLYEAYGPRGDSEGVIDRTLQAQYVRSQSPGRQRYNQAISSFAEAVLRAATGAGVNRDEAAQKVRELTPQAGDSTEVRAQKLRGLDGYLDDLKTRAGRALAPGNQGIPTVSTKAQYDALPSGTVFIEDGKQYRKP